MDSTLKGIIRRQVPYLLGGAITGAILTYYYGFFFSLIVNSTLWTAISFTVSKFYYQCKGGMNDQKYLLEYAKALIGSRR
jgi:ABC-type transport system involved in Fe-S cluster assembly fused permease/ATPase subunit